ncbi:unnamed protein product [Vitrella brassicaformis CCMP3155]|uniref:Uncharacterized protein n=1 Tax=Vitrella brassicaformis (strain CCMP3155) TaxID=1169540 RepID=A0A0G4F2X2_VITBC|nr:unnamed protein product [Vitrella brassicaformis CCMP3155]|eukprot:CEM05847.1 unnamed protein product [Vitrella brassicaformis CCMP3155]
MECDSTAVGCLPSSLLSGPTTMDEDDEMGGGSSPRRRGIKRLCHDLPQEFNKKVRIGSPHPSPPPSLPPIDEDVAMRGAGSSQRDGVLAAAAPADHTHGAHDMTNGVPQQPQQTAEGRPIAPASQRNDLLAPLPPHHHHQQQTSEPSDEQRGIVLGRGMPPGSFYQYVNRDLGQLHAERSHRQTHHRPMMHRSGSAPGGLRSSGGMGMGGAGDQGEGQGDMSYGEVNRMIRDLHFGGR